jgi:hypothetical protein
MKKTLLICLVSLLIGFSVVWLWKHFHCETDYAYTFQSALVGPPEPICSVHVLYIDYAPVSLMYMNHEWSMVMSFDLPDFMAR